MKTNKPDKKFVDSVLAVMDGIGFVAEGGGYTDIESTIKINLAICDEVAQDVWDTADREAFNEDDVRFAVGRVLRKRLGIPED